jgi:DNA-binding NtrC family response regulator
MNYLELLHSPILTPRIATLTEKAAYNNIPVFIQGEHGTGKELTAKRIHHLGDRKDYRFYKIDCRISTEETFTAQLSRLFKESHDGTSPGTLYLREVGYLGQENQLDWSN